MVHVSIQPALTIACVKMVGLEVTVKSVSCLPLLVFSQQELYPFTSIEPKIVVSLYLYLGKNSFVPLLVFSQK